jgi:hypothetical protein
MSQTKIKNDIETLYDQAKDMASNAAIIAMAAATIIGMTELTGRQDLKMQPVYAFSGSNSYQPAQDNNIRKENEEVAHHPMSYGVTMRSEAISGKR